MPIENEDIRMEGDAWRPWTEGTNVEAQLIDVPSQNYEDITFLWYPIASWEWGKNPKTGEKLQKAGKLPQRKLNEKRTQE